VLMILIVAAIQKAVGHREEQLPELGGLTG